MTDRGYHIPYLEWMITTSCDLACPGCDRFIEYDHNWTENFQDIKQRMVNWSKKLDPDNLTLIGGEPLIHPNLYDIIKHSAKCFDHSTIEIYTNGLLLHKKPKLYNTLRKIGKAKLSVTLHNRNPQIRKWINYNLDQQFFQKDKWNKVGKNYWKSGNIEIEITDPTQGGWYEYRKKVNGKIKPWNDNDINSSYSNCTANVYPIIYKDKLYKCPPISMLITQATKYNFLNDKDWELYLNYKPYSADDNLEDFIQNINCAHNICNMCPANPVLIEQPEAIVKHNIEKLVI